MLRIWNFFKKKFCLFWFLLDNVKSESKNKFILYNICTYITPHLNSHNNFEWNLPLKIKTKYVVQTYVNSKYFLMSFNTELIKKIFSENIKNYQRILINKYYLMMHIIIVLRNVWMICLYTYMLFIRLYMFTSDDALYYFMISLQWILKNAYCITLQQLHIRITHLGTF